MNKRVLVLNQDYTPLTVCSIQRAFLLIFLQKAELVSQFEGQVLRTVSRHWPKPAVIRIGRYINVPYKGVELSRQVSILWYKVRVDLRPCTAAFA